MVRSRRRPYVLSWNQTPTRTCCYQPLESDRRQVGQGHPGQIHYFVDTAAESDTVFDVDDCSDIILPIYTAAVELELASARSTCRLATAVGEPLRRSTWFPATSTRIYVDYVPDFDAVSKPLHWTTSWVWIPPPELSGLWKLWLS